MPIGRRNLTTQNRGSFLIPGSTASGAIRSGAAVALVDTGTTQIVECSSASNGMAFIGFAALAAGNGDEVVVSTLRGSTVTPIIEGGGTFSNGDPVYLSATSGEVTNTPVITGASIRVGIGINGTQLTMVGDSQIQIP